MLFNQMLLNEVQSTTGVHEHEYMCVRARAGEAELSAPGRAVVRGT